MKNFLLSLLAAGCAGLLPVSVRAQSNLPGQVDVTFDAGEGLNWPDGIIRALAVQADGKVVIGGDFNNVRNELRIHLARLNADGSPDTNFFHASIGEYNNAEQVRALAFQTNGMIVVGGSFSYVDGMDQPNLVQLDTNGVPDPSWSPQPDGAVRALLTQPDGKLLVAGEFYGMAGTYSPFLARLLPDGTFDPSWMGGNGPSGPVLTMALQPDGQILIGGEFTEYNGAYRPYVARLKADGSVDFSFDPGGGPSYPVKSLAVETNGSVVIGGDFDSVNGFYCYGIVRLDTNGVVDANFSPVFYSSDGFEYDPDNGYPRPEVSQIAVMADGDILVGGQFGYVNDYNTRRPALARLNADGSLDDDFAPGSGIFGRQNYSPRFTTALAVRPDGRLLTAGYLRNGPDYFEHRFGGLNADGTADATFTVSSGLDNYVSAALEQADGKVVVGGFFSSFHGIPMPGLGRLHPDGTRDNGFNIGTGPDDSVTSLHRLTNGQILVGGYFHNFNGQRNEGVVRLGTNGTLDATFRVDTNFIYGYSYDTAVQSNGQILVGGGFWESNYVRFHGLVRLNADGSWDRAFSENLPMTNDVAYRVMLQTDGKILITGNFTNINGVSRPRLARLNTNGTLDTTFDPGTGPESLGSEYTSVDHVQPLPNGQVLVGGYFRTFSGAPRPSLVRLNDNGSVDLTYAPGFQTNQYSSGSLYAMTLLPDGRLLTNPDGLGVNVNYGHIGRRSTAGAVDPNFDMEAGANSSFNRIVPLASGKILGLGYFNRVNGLPRGRVVRLHGGDLPPSAPFFRRQPQNQFVYYNAAANFEARASGSLPLSFQWRLNGVALPGETNVTLSITHAASADAGDYSLLASNHLGVAVSSNAVLTVYTQPAFSRYPVNTNVNPGETIFFDAELLGEPPFGFQWFFQGTPLVGATNLSLTITNADFVNSGYYYLQVTNRTGTNYAYVQARVVLPLPVAVDATNLVWTTGGNNGWFYQTDQTFDGEDAARSGETSDNGESWMETTVTGPGQLHFWWMVSSEQFGDQLSFLLDGAEWRSITGDVGFWEDAYIDIPAGPHTVRWSYHKDGNFSSSGADAGWVDLVSFTPYSLGVPERSPDDSLTIPVSGPPYQYVVVESSTDLIEWVFYEGLALDFEGHGQVIIPDLTLDPYRFYRMYIPSPAGPAAR